MVLHIFLSRSDVVDAFRQSVVVQSTFYSGAPYSAASAMRQLRANWLI
jgi:hypothetical protein